MRSGGRPKIVVLGMMSTMPVAGVVWQTLHYLLGFERLGFDTYYVEAHARTPSMLMTTKEDDAAALAARFIDATLRPHGFGRSWAFHALHADGRCHGLSRRALRRLYRDAALVVNLHGGTVPLPEHSAGGRLVYLETDPVQLQIELFEGRPETIELLDQHCAYFTFGENYQRPGCTLPRSDRYEFHATRQPVLLDVWAADDAPSNGAFTTVGNWSQSWRNVSFDGRVYGWSKDQQFRRFLDLPAASGADFELALANCAPEDRALLEATGWTVRPAAALSADAERYRRYIRHSHAEFTVAKEQNVAFRTGWFSDRSATYLASGRPVVTQDTGFGANLPTGSGLMAFSSSDGAVASVESVLGDYDRHRAAAREIARSCFGHDVVLGSMLDVLGVARARRSRRRPAPRYADLPEGLVIAPVSKRPIRLAPETSALLAGRRRDQVVVNPRPVVPGSPCRISIVVPVHDRAELTQLCLESVLVDPTLTDHEIVVVDDASAAETTHYLATLAATHPTVRVLRNDANLGFARSVNRGIAASRGELVVLLNNDTVVTPGWAQVLLGHLHEPNVGLVTACTAGSSRNCRVRADYRTYAELCGYARTRARAQAGEQRVVEMAPLFAAALRRAVLEEIGPLDEQFELAMFEDDDYALRLAGAGYQIVCALDAFVHHFGEGTLGDLHASGEFHALLDANRLRFERKWDRPWDPTEQLLDDDGTVRAEVAEIRALLARVVPAGDTVAIVSHGDDEIVVLEGRRGRHLPCSPSGEYLGAHPRDDAEVIDQVEAARAAGAHWLFVPEWSAWWLDHYGALRPHLDAVGTLASEDRLGRLFELAPRERTSPGVEPRSEPALPDGGCEMDHDVAAGCTIIARNYLGQARVLADSYFHHHPQGRFYLLVVDGLPAGTEVDPRIVLVDPEMLPLDRLHEMCFKYDVVELSTAVKPALLILLMDHFAEARVMYLDPDIRIFRPMTEVFEALDGADIVLTPHLNAPIPQDGRAPREQDILISGAYNLGFIALRRGEQTPLFLDWWRERLNDLCRVDPAGGLMVDQRWIDLVPSLFASTRILRDDTYNVAYWNLHARAIGRDGAGAFTCNGRPLTMFHFSGYKPDRPEVLSKHQNRTELVPGTALHEIFDEYGAAMLAAGFEESQQWPYGLSRFDNGIGLHAIFRRLYLELDEDRQRELGDPFATGVGSFFDWATAPSADRRSLSPFLEAAYRLRYDVQAAYPDVANGDRAPFLEWARTQGATEFGFEPELIARCDAAGAACDPPAASAPAGLGGSGTVDVLDTLPGVNVCGYLRNESGLGAAARGYIGLLEHLGVPISLRDVSDLSVNRSHDPSVDSLMTRWGADHVHPVNLVCVNADQHFVVKATDPRFFEDRYNIGVWFWELPSFPAEWMDRFEHYDELWVGSSYIANALAPVSPIPVVRIPPVLGAQRSGDRSRGRAAIGAAPDEFVYLFMFDFHSYFERKNPMAVVAAFRQAFGPTERVRLVVKSVNGASNVDGLGALRRAASEDPRVTVIDEYCTSEEVEDLTLACDAYVSLHRAEGTGLTMAHAMAAGKPVIATGWSGNTDFMDASNSLLVRFDLIELDRDIGPYKRGEMWADPDVDHAAALMRFLYEQPDEARALGLTAQRNLLARFSAERIGRDAGKRLEVVRGQVGRSRARSAAVPIEHGGNEALMSAIRRVVASAAPDDRPVVVVSKGDPVLTRLDGHPAWHFPQNDDGEYAGYYPSDAATAIAHLEQLRARGAGYFLVPATSRWWLQHYGGLREHLEARYALVAEDASCVLFRLDHAAESPDSEASLLDLRESIEHLAETLAATGEWVTDLAPRVERGELQLAGMPSLLLEAFTSVVTTIGDVESDLDERLAGLELRQAALARDVEGLGARVGATVEVPMLSAGAGAPTAIGAPPPLELPPIELPMPPAATACGALERAPIEQRLRARPYMSTDRFFTEDPDRPMGFSRDDRREHEREGLPSFADVFRGERAFIANRQQVYVPFFRSREHVLDIGCGRGEFLELLADEGIRAEGVEQDGSLVRDCRRRGLRVEEDDALAYLDNLAPSTVDAIFSAQFIEHLDPSQLQELLVLAQRALRPGGLFVAETVNPENFEAFKTFHVDLTHQRPIFPQVLLHLCWENAFDAAWIFYPLGGGFTQRCYDAVGEYAVVASA